MTEHPRGLIPQTAEYALRAMTVLAGLDRAVPAAELAQLTHIPHAYLSKTMRRLVVAGLAESQKGHGGGFRLGRAARAICIADVFGAVGFVVDDDGCVFGWGACNAAEPCPLHPIWVQIRMQLESWASETTLQSLDLHKVKSLRVLP